MSLRIKDFTLGGADDKLTVDEVLLYAFVVHAASIDLVDVGRHTRLAWLDMERKATFVGSLWQGDGVVKEQ